MVMAEQVEPEKEEVKLTEKQRIFCERYTYHWNGARAAREAGYSEETARAIASENLTKPYILAYIEVCKRDLERLTGISKQRVLDELQKMAFYTVADIHDTWIDRKKFDELTDDQKSAISEIETRVVQRNVGTQEEPEIYDVEQIKVKFHDKKGAIVEINKMLGYNEPEKRENTYKGDPLINLHYNGEKINLKDE